MSEFTTTTTTTTKYTPNTRKLERKRLTAPLLDVKVRFLLVYKFVNRHETFRDHYSRGDIAVGLYFDRDKNEWKLVRLISEMDFEHIVRECYAKIFYLPPIRATIPQPPYGFTLSDRRTYYTAVLNEQIAHHVINIVLRGGHDTVICQDGFFTDVRYNSYANFYVRVKDIIVHELNKRVHEALPTQAEGVDPLARDKNEAIACGILFALSAFPAEELIDKFTLSITEDRENTENSDLDAINTEIDWDEENIEALLDALKDDNEEELKRLLSYTYETYRKHYNKKYNKIMSKEKE